MGAVNNKTRSKKSRPKTSDLNLFDWLAPNYENLQGAIDPSRFQFHSIMLDILNALELEPETVLDLGCGTGTLAGQILELFEDSHVYLIDNSLQMLEIARDELVEFTERITLAKADFRDEWEEVVEQGIDAVIHYKALHNLPESSYREIYERLLDILNPGGILVSGELIDPGFSPAIQRISDDIAEIHSVSLRTDMVHKSDLLSELDKIRGMKLKQGELLETRISAEKHIEWLLDAGYECASVVYQEWNQAIIVARKPL